MMTFLIQESIEESIKYGHLVRAGYAMLISGLLISVFGTAVAIVRKERFRYWQIAFTLLVLGLAALSGLMDEGLKIVAGQLTGGG